jgi:hypothetical protein
MTKALIMLNPVKESNTLFKFGFQAIGWKKRRK